MRPLISLFTHALLFCSQHSMIYFYHHYELPVILQRYRLQQFLLTQRTTNANGDSVPFVSATIIRQDDAAGRSGASGAVARPADGPPATSSNVGHLHVIPVRPENGQQPSLPLRPQSALQQQRSWTLRIFSTFGVALRRHRHRLARGGNDGRLGVENFIAGLTSQATHAVGTIRLLRRNDGGAANNAGHGEGATDERDGAEASGTSEAGSASYATPNDGFGVSRISEASFAPTSGSSAPTSQRAATQPPHGAVSAGPDIIASTPTNADASPDVVTSSSAPPAPSLFSSLTPTLTSLSCADDGAGVKSTAQPVEAAESHKSVTDGSSSGIAQSRTTQ